MAIKKIVTERLELIGGTEEIIRAEIGDRSAFSRLLNACVPETWPPELTNEDTMRFSLNQVVAEGPEWTCWYIVQRDDRALVGLAGFKGGPGPEGTVEIGYSILEEYRNRGYCQEAVLEMVLWAFNHPGVEKVAAETLPCLEASIRVLERCGFSFAGEGQEEGAVRFCVSRERR